MIRQKYIGIYIKIAKVPLILCSLASYGKMKAVEYDLRLSEHANLKCVKS